MARRSPPIPPPPDFPLPCGVALPLGATPRVPPAKPARRPRVSAPGPVAPRALPPPGPSSSAPPVPPMPPALLSAPGVRPGARRAPPIPPRIFDVPVEEAPVPPPPAGPRALLPAPRPRQVLPAAPPVPRRLGAGTPDPRSGPRAPVVAPSDANLAFAPTSRRGAGAPEPSKRDVLAEALARRVVTLDAHVGELHRTSVLNPLQVEEILRILPATVWLRAPRRTFDELQRAARDLDNAQRLVQQAEALHAEREAVRSAAAQPGRVQQNAAGVERNGVHVLLWTSTLPLARSIGRTVLWADPTRVVADESMSEPVVGTKGDIRRVQWRVAYVNAAVASEFAHAADRALLALPEVAVSPLLEREAAKGTVPLPPPPKPREPPPPPKLPPYAVFLVRVPDSSWTALPEKPRVKFANEVRTRRTLLPDGGIEFGPVVGSYALVILAKIRSMALDPHVELLDVTDQWVTMKGILKDVLKDLSIPYQRAVTANEEAVYLVPPGTPQQYADAFAALQDAAVITPDGQQWSLHRAEPEEARVPRTEFEIPIENLYGVEKKIEGLARRAEKLKQVVPTLTKIGEPYTKIVTVQREIPNPYGDRGSLIVADPQAYRVQKVHIEGLAPMIQGWAVIGVLEPTVGGENKVYAVSTHPLSLRYRYTGSTCQHCNLIRTRNKVVVLREASTGREQQVGVSCLKDFTGHASPEAIAGMAEEIWKLLGSLEESEDLGHGKPGYVLDEFLRHVAELTLRNGFVSKKTAEAKGLTTTGDLAILWMRRHTKPVKGLPALLGFDPTEPPSAAAVELATNARAWALSIPPNTPEEYLNNLRLIAMDNGVYSNGTNFAASMIEAYRRATMRAAEAAQKAQQAGRPPAHVGTVGSPWVGFGVVTRLYQHEGDRGISHMVTVQTMEAGIPAPDVIKWWTNVRGDELPAPTTILKLQGKVKEHKYYADRRNPMAPQVPETHLERVKTTFWPLFLGRQPWQYTRAEWDANPVVVGWRQRAALVDAPEHRDLTPEEFAVANGLPPDPRRPTGTYAMSWHHSNYPAAEHAWIRPQIEAWHARNMAARNLLDTELHQLGRWLVSQGLVGGLDVLPDADKPLPDHATVVREAYAEGFPVPPAVLADYPAEIATVDAARAAEAQKLAAKAARAAKRAGKTGAGPDAPAIDTATPEGKALASGFGPFVRALLAVRETGAQGYFQRTNRFPPALKIGFTTADAAEVAEGDQIPPSPFVATQGGFYSLLGSSEPYRVVFAPRAIELQRGVPTRHHFRYETQRKVPYGSAEAIEACAEWLLNVPPRAVPSPGWGSPATEAAARDVLNEFRDILRHSFHPATMLAEIEGEKPERIARFQERIPTVQRDQLRYYGEQFAHMHRYISNAREKKERGDYLGPLHFAALLDRLIETTALANAQFVGEVQAVLAAEFAPLAPLDRDYYGAIETWIGETFPQEVARRRAKFQDDRDVQVVQAWLQAQGARDSDWSWLDNRVFMFLHAFGREIALAHGQFAQWRAATDPVTTARVAALGAFLDWVARMAANRPPRVAPLAVQYLAQFTAIDPAAAAFTAPFAGLIERYRKRVKTDAPAA